MKNTYTRKTSLSLVAAMIVCQNIAFAEDKFVGTCNPSSACVQSNGSLSITNQQNVTVNGSSGTSQPLAFEGSEGGHTITIKDSSVKVTDANGITALMSNSSDAKGNSLTIENSTIEAPIISGGASNNGHTIDIKDNKVHIKNTTFKTNTSNGNSFEIRGAGTTTDSNKLNAYNNEVKVIFDDNSKKVENIDSFIIYGATGGGDKKENNTVFVDGLTFEKAKVFGILGAQDAGISLNSNKVEFKNSNLSGLTEKADIKVLAAAVDDKKQETQASNNKAVIEKVEIKDLKDGAEILFAGVKNAKTSEKNELTIDNLKINTIEKEAKIDIATTAVLKNEQDNSIQTQDATSSNNKATITSVEINNLKDKATILFAGTKNAKTSEKNELTIDNLKINTIKKEAKIDIVAATTYETKKNGGKDQPIKIQDVTANNNKVNIKNVEIKDLKDGAEIVFAGTRNAKNSKNNELTINNLTMQNFKGHDNDINIKIYGHLSDTDFDNDGEITQNSVNISNLNLSMISADGGANLEIMGADADGKVNENRVKISNLTLKDSNLSSLLIGGVMSQDGKADMLNQNFITIDNLKMEQTNVKNNSELFAAQANQNGATNNNTLKIESSTTVFDRIIGGDGSGGERNNNKVIIQNLNNSLSGNGTVTKHLTIAGGHDNGNGMANDNQVFIDKLTNQGDAEIYGGYVKENGNVINNFVVINNITNLKGKIHGGYSKNNVEKNQVKAANFGADSEVEIYGGKTEHGNLNNNTVNIRDFESHKAKIYGAYASSATDSTITNNSVTISNDGKNFMGDVYGVYIDNGTVKEVTGNKVEILNSQITGNVYGVYFKNNNKTFKDNTVTIKNSQIIGTIDLQGGRLNIKGKSNNGKAANTATMIKNVGTLVFYEPNKNYPLLGLNSNTDVDLKNTETLIVVNDIDDFVDEIGDEGATLIEQQGNGKILLPNIIEIDTRDDFVSKTLIENENLKTVDSDKNFRIKRIKKTIRKEALSMQVPQIASAGVLSIQNDMTINQLTDLRYVQKDVVTFAKIQGYDSDLKLGDTNVKGFNLSAGVAKTLENSKIAAFIELGKSKYDSNLGTSSKGDINSFGVGVMGEVDLNDVFYTQAFAKVGKISRDFNAKIRTTNVNYKLNTPYISAGVFAGAKIPVSENISFENRVGYVYSHINGDTKDINGGSYAINDINSHRAIFDSRASFVVNKISPFIGVRVENEFDTKTELKSKRSVIKADNKGISTGINGGIDFKPTQFTNLTLFFGKTFGKKESTAAELTFKYEF